MTPWVRRVLGLLHLGGKHLPCVYNSRYAIDVPGLRQDSRRSEHILTFLAMEGLIRRGDLEWAKPASFADLARVHTEAYLTSLTETGGLVPMLGAAVGPELEERVLAAQRFMAGGTAQAARLALTARRTVVNLGGGLHHAHADRGHGFCLVNDVAVAIRGLRAGGFVAPILVVDLDLHDGDGTRSIFAEDETVYTFSIHNQNWDEGEAVAATRLALGPGVEDAVYLQALRAHLPAVVAAVKPGLVFYLAGVDPAADDALGNWRISAQGLLERDRLVFAELDRLPGLRPPVVVLLAGGYGTNAWRHSARSLSWLSTGGTALEPPSTEEIILKRYRFFASLVPDQYLTSRPKENELGLSAEDLLPAGSPHTWPRFLDFYSPQGVELALERYGFLGRLRSMGFGELALDFELENPAGQTLRIFGDAARTELLVELRLRRDRRALPGRELLFVEWLLLQNPRASFTPDRPALPGQKHPGLALLRDVVALFVLICDRLHLDGVVFLPAHFHIAAQAHSHAHFLTPEAEGRYLALERDLAPLGIGEASQALASGRVLDETTGQTATWEPAPMVIPASPAIAQQLVSPEHREQVAEVAARHRFRLEAS